MEAVTIGLVRILQLMVEIVTSEYLMIMLCHLLVAAEAVEYIAEMR